MGGKGRVRTRATEAPCSGPQLGHDSPDGRLENWEADSLHRGASLPAFQNPSCPGPRVGHMESRGGGQ